MKVLDRIMVCLYLGIAVSPFVAMRLGARDHLINGAVAEARYAKLSFERFQSEDYQRMFTAWFEGHLGLKGYSVASDNSILYHVFRETKPGSQVVLGDGGVLFKDEDIAYYNKDAAQLPPQVTIDALADKLAALQTKLRAHQRAFVPLIIPSKTTLYRDAVPQTWTRALGEPRPSDLGIYQAMKRALDARGVTYADARALFTSRGIARELLWGPNGRHWTDYGACLAMREVLDAYALLAGRTVPPLDCSLSLRWHPTSHDDFDLWRLLNVWKPPRPKKVIPVVAYPPPPADAFRPSVMFVGTSFCWNLLHCVGDSQRFGGTHMDYYNKLLVPWPDTGHLDVKPRTAPWREVFLQKDLYVLDLLEVFLLAPDTYVDQFLVDISEELDTTLKDTDEASRSGAAITGVVDLGVTDGEHHFELWGTFPDPAKPYTATVTCDGIRRRATVYYQAPHGGQLNVHTRISPGTCDRTQPDPRVSGVSCTFRIRQGETVGSPAFGPRKVCPGPQGGSGQGADGRCLAGLAGC